MDTQPDPDEPRGTEVVEGEVDVLVAGTTVRVLIPAGVGIPGLDDVGLAEELVRELQASRVSLPDVVDAAQIAARQPEVLAAIDARLDQ
jgi:hypothetical protein